VMGWGWGWGWGWGVAFACFGSVTILIVINGGGYHSRKTFLSLSERLLFCLNAVCLADAV